MPWLVRFGALASCGALLGCPQLLSDDFRMTSNESPPDGGYPVCTRPVCETQNLDASVLPPSRPADAESAPLDAGSGGSPTQSPPQPEPQDAGPSAPNAPPDCWKVVLNDRTHIASNNCLGIHGWNDAVSDTSGGSSVGEMFQQGDVCLAGNIAAGGWGVVYSLTLADEQLWDAPARGVAGFALSFYGSALPPEAEVLYTQAGDDYCREVVPTGEVSVPFDTTHPGCSTTSTSVPDPTRLTFIRLHLPAVGSAYDYDFCLGLRAIP